MRWEGGRMHWCKGNNGKGRVKFECSREKERKRKDLPFSQATIAPTTTQNLNKNKTKNHARKGLFLLEFLANGNP